MLLSPEWCRDVEPKSPPGDYEQFIVFYLYSYYFIFSYYESMNMDDILIGMFYVFFLFVHPSIHGGFLYCGIIKGIRGIICDKANYPEVVVSYVRDGWGRKRRVIGKCRSSGDRSSSGCLVSSSNGICPIRSITLFDWTTCSSTGKISAIPADGKSRSWASDGTTSCSGHRPSPVKKLYVDLKLGDVAKKQTLIKMLSYDFVLPWFLPGIHPSIHYLYPLSREGLIKSLQPQPACLWTVGGNQRTL